jgi:hypothetical protein
MAKPVPRRSHGPGSGAPPTAPSDGGFRGGLKTDADRKLYDSMVKNFGGDFKGLGRNVRTASGDPGVTDAQALAQKFKNAQLAQKQAGAVKPPVVGAPPSTPPSGTPPGVPPSTSPVGGVPAPTSGGVTGGATAPLAGLATALPRGPMNTAPTAGPGGGALGGGEGLGYIDGPATLRQGIGQRMLPQLNSVLAGLSRAY